MDDDTPKTIELLRKLTKDDPKIEVCSLRAIYPKGAEKVTTYETTVRIVQ